VEASLLPLSVVPPSCRRRWPPPAPAAPTLFLCPASLPVPQLAALCAGARPRAGTPRPGDAALGPWCPVPSSDCCRAGAQQQRQQPTATATVAAHRRRAPAPAAATPANTAA